MIDQNGNRAGVATSENVHLVKVGLNYKLGQGLPWSAAASAVPILPAPPPAAWNWSGVYVGGHVGGGWGRTNWNSATGILGARNGVFAGSSTDNGFAIGGQVGINHQVGAWVVGAEADASWSDIDGYAKCATNGDPSGSFTCHTRVKALGTLTGRLGQSFGNLLVYGKGGAAWDAERHGALEDQPNSQFAGDTTRWGWTAGVGLEYAFTPAWSGKVEYNFMRFGDQTSALQNAHGVASNVGLSQDLSVFKMGFNYKLGADPTAGSRAPVPAPMWVKSPVFKAPPRSDWTIEAGARYWVSSGHKQLDLFGSTSSVFLSRLTYDGVIGHSVESFARLDHRNGIFLKGNFGLGDLTKGKFYDEDTHAPDHIVGYSNTRSNQGDGRTLYGSLDIGHAIVTGPGGDLGAYVGYRYLYERDNGFGGSQIAASRSIFFQGAAPFSTLILSETEAWSGAAVGLNTRLQLAERWRLEVDAALLPFVGVWNTDNHWLRPDFNPLPAQGQGWGSQFEAILSYALTDQWSIGAGGRYWYFASSSVHTQSPNTIYNQPIKLFSERYGGFVQATYKFDGKPSAAPAGGYKLQSGPTTWTGFYAGGHIGAGLGRTTWSDPFPPPALGDYVTMGGALAGGQLGFNYQTGTLVYGVEAAGSWARIAGTFTCFAGNPDISVAGQDCGARVGALASFTGRLGYALDRTLYYAKAGPAWGRSTFQLNFGAADAGQIVTTSVNRVGWTLGGGVEQALTDKWSVVGEYRYVDLGSVKVSFSGIPDSISTDGPVAINQRYHMLMLGMNYRLY